MTGPALPGLIDPLTEPLPEAVPLGNASGLGRVSGRVRRAVPYAVRPGYRPLLLDLYLPEVAGAPVVLFVHGGGWRVGDRAVFCPTWRDWSPQPFARLVEAGFAVASVDYRLSGEALFPAQLDDVMAALHWLRIRSQELGIDTGRVVAWGESAGAHLAALLGLTESPAVVGVVDWYGPTDLLTMAAGADASDSREALLLGASPLSVPERARAASPLPGCMRRRRRSISRTVSMIGSFPLSRVGGSPPRCALKGAMPNSTLSPGRGICGWGWRTLRASS